MMYEFSVGDRVECIVDCPDDNEILTRGMTGTVCISVSNDYPNIGVAWDENICGHDCKESCEYGFGWFVSADQIRLVKECVIEYDEKELEALFGISMTANKGVCQDDIK